MTISFIWSAAIRGKRRLIIAALFAGALCTEATYGAEKPYGGVGDPSKEHVVLFHGITESKYHMYFLEKFLKEKGYDVINIDYPSTKHSFPELVKMEKEVVKKELASKKGYVHFVGHSMGGMMIRGILNGYKPEKFGRVVHLGTPNHGSEFADLLKDFGPYQWFFGPAGQQLTTNNKDAEKVMGEPDYPTGIIAGITSFDVTLIGSRVIPGEDDSMVSVESTKLKGMDDFVILNNGEHVFQPLNGEAHELIYHYLKYGKFKGEPGKDGAAKSDAKQ